MIDSHAHLFLDGFDEDRSAVFDRARAGGVDHFVVVGIDLESSVAARDLASGRDDCSPTAGVHPNDLTGVSEEDWTHLDELLASGSFVAVGETGLDFYWKNTTPEVQHDGLRRHCALARRHDLPLILHCRDAWPALLDHLEAEGDGVRGVMHCFSGGVRELDRSLALGFDVSFAGPLTYPRSKELRAACAAAPADRIHLETDCPFLPPQGHRGKRNEPAYLATLLETMADVRGVSVEEMDAVTSANTRRLFGLT